ncbi:outer membrane protein assembly factor BamE [Paraburkholderia rhynchosiae]|uniref:Outer membrane protein assembly factor BamE n=1 Tax=Paraburkholderia rhynchosiae TaxID=487049 RepID=A0A2N7WR54_9BURK|nr:outer membrane protein assembly factor BamE [Paraburkholderia rhynchosiae]PMS31880.1 outer membrane protein assembly factor BamE [Paraburkholderia rhynchosiae]CAB3649659.1 Outer membrane protein assembly factor BamE [Paraburkholderia rhynchosiae]
MRGTLIAVAAVAILAGCSTYDSLTQRIAQSITPYRITVVQGNFVSKEAASQMQAGMSRAQVRQLLGTPLLADMFHADRWDYVFYFKRGSTNVVQQRDFVVMFAGDRVASWSGGEDLPSNLELLAEIDGDKRGKKAAVPNVASSAAGASAPVAAAPVTVDTTRSPSVEDAAAAAAPSTDANAEAAQAANRATNAVQAPSRTRQSSVRSTAPTANAGGVPPQGPTSGGQPQFQFHRPPPPQSSSQENPVGPTGSQSSSGPTYNAPLTAPSTSGTSE